MFALSKYRQVEIMRTDSFPFALTSPTFSSKLNGQVTYITEVVKTIQALGYRII